MTLTARGFSNLNYRLATLNDIDNICSLVSEVIKQMENKGIYQWDSLYPAREDFYIDINKKALYIAEDGHKFAAIYVIHRLCVAPSFQNKGIGKQVLKHIEEQAAKLSYTSARLDVYAQNSYALKMYIHSGYEKRGFADWRKGRFILMEKAL